MEYISTISKTNKTNKINKIKNSLDINDWNNYIYTKKLKLINDIDTSNILDSSTDSLQFNTILKDIIKINIINISYIAFMILKFLETSFIPSEILLNVINIYSEDEMWVYLIKNTKKININDNNYKIDTYKYNKTLKFIINYIIEFVVKIEVSITIQCLLITNLINKINYKQTTNYNTTNYNTTNYNTTKDDIFKPKIYNIFNKSNKYICNTIKSSTIILLLLNFINKLNNNNNNDDNNNNDINNDNEIINLMNIHNNTNLLTYINKKKDINKKINMYLDIFILEITHYFCNNTNINNNMYPDMYPDIYMICSKYIVNNIELMFNNFENIFIILETHLLKSININEKKIKTLLYLKNVIKNLADIEFDNIKKLFYL
jgi:hypothetical protein